MQRFERDRQELRVIQKNEVSYSYVAQKVKMLAERKLWAKKCVGQDRHFSAHAYCERVQDEKLVYNNNAISFSNHVKKDSFLTEFHYF